MSLNPRLDEIRKSFTDSAANLRALAQSENGIAALGAAAELICRSYQAGGSLFVAGNGGSAADAQHLVAELVARVSRDRTPIRAFALTVDSSILTAIGNDYGYEEVFSRQVLGLMRPNDVLLAITTSGKSPNILAALKACRALGAKSVLLSARDGGAAAPLADLTILAPGQRTDQIQECHQVIYHTLCGLIEADLVRLGLCSYA